MSSPGTPTYDQLRIFLAVVETGSFAAAGRRLNRATSVISYGVANLEAQLGLPVDLERRGHGGRVTVTFHDDGDLDALYRALGGAQL